MNRYWITSGVLASAILFVPAHAVHARTEITCLFSWDENAEANIKGHSQRAATLKKVSKEAFRLDPAGAMPDCNALQATVVCEGMEAPKAE